jgi:hypothetical protein
MNAWAGKPQIVSLGAQKNFDRFMEEITAKGTEAPMPDATSYKLMIAKAIIFKRAQNLIRPMFPAFQANILAYLMAVLANRIGARMNLQRVWDRQDVSPELTSQLRTWASEVHQALAGSANGRMLSEWAKKDECWEIVCASNYTPVVDMPEFDQRTVR